MKASTVDLIRTSDQESGLHVIHLPVGWKVTRESIDLWGKKFQREILSFLSQMGNRSSWPLLLSISSRRGTEVGRGN